MNLFWWAVAFGVLFATARAAIDIALDRIPQRPARDAAAWAAGSWILGLLTVLGSPSLSPLGLTLLLHSAANAAQGWLLRNQPKSTLPPVRY